MMPIIIKTIINIDKNQKKIWEKNETIRNEIEHKCNEMKKAKQKQKKKNSNITTDITRTRTILIYTHMD